MTQNIVGDGQMAEIYEKKTFEFFEKLRFFYGHPDSKKLSKTVNSKVGGYLKTGLELLVIDICVLQEGDVTHPKYEEAFSRYCKFYKDLTPEELEEYKRYICRRYGIKLPEARIKIRTEPFKTPEELNAAISRR